MSDTTERLRDAAYATGIPADWTGAVGGYYGGPGAYHIWPHADWARFGKNKKLPIWVPAEGNKNGAEDGTAALAALRALGVPRHAWTALDMETMEDRSYADAFGQAVRPYYRVWVYGSAGSVFANPPLDGYWVADYAGIGAFMYQPPAGQEIRATQYASGQDWDSSTVKDFTWLDRRRWWI